MSALEKDLYRRMVLIREVEERIVKLYPEREMRCPTHLSIGQEAVAAGVCAALKKDDSIFLSHRCHAGYIAKGGDIGALFAELYGKKTGCTKGRGGSMHLVDPDAGVMGTSAILSGTVPIACGAALAYARKQSGQVAACFFGDAAVEEGTFYESLSLAALWKLPVLFICENNGYSTCTPLSKRQPPVSIHGRAKAFGVETAAIDGNDVRAVHAAAAKAVERARRGRGPTFIECATYRWLEHVGPFFDWNMGYRSKEEVEAWMKKCPIKRFEKEFPAADREKIRASILKGIDEAVDFAKTSEFPDPAELLETLDA